MMEILKTATLLLVEHGREFIVVVEAAAIIMMARYIVGLHAQQRDDDKNTITMLEGFKGSVEALTKAIDRLVDKRGG